MQELLPRDAPLKRVRSAGRERGPYLRRCCEPFTEDHKTRALNGWTSRLDEGLRGPRPCRSALTSGPFDRHRQGIDTFADLSRRVRREPKEKSLRPWSPEHVAPDWNGFDVLRRRGDGDRFGLQARPKPCGDMRPRVALGQVEGS